MTENVIVEGVAGMRPFTGWEVPGMRDLPAVDSRGPLTVVVYDDGTPHGFPAVVPVSTVTELSRQEQDALEATRRYRREWAVKRHCSEREVYVPSSLRPSVVPEEAW
jgi:hypothetical protein